jgi:hypothetical protein
LVREFDVLVDKFRPPKVLQIKRGIPDGCKYGDFIAVSYSSEHTPGLECGRSRGFTVIEAGGESRRESIVRDEVLTRVLRYARHNGLRRFWIDRECSPLGEDSERNRSPWIPWIFYIVRVGIRSGSWQ